MTDNESRHEELLAFIRENTARLTWPQIEKSLKDRGFSDQEITAALHAAFPGQKIRKTSKALRGGLIGAVIGSLVWFILAALYRSSR